MKFINMREIFPGIFIGNYIVCLHNYVTTEQKAGDIYQVLPISKEGELNIEGEAGYFSEPSNWRLATPEEIEWYFKGNSNINNIKTELYDIC